MSNLIKAFKRMRRHGLLARPDFYCEECGPEVVLDRAHAAQKHAYRKIQGGI